MRFTGGNGGALPGQSLNVLQDISALVTKRILVGSAGVKRRLDIPHTLEALGLPILVRGSKLFPGLYSPESGCVLPVFVPDERATTDIFLCVKKKG